MEGTCLLHISVDGNQESAGRPFSSLLIELALANYPGIYYTSAPDAGSVYGAYWPALVPQDVIQHTVVHADGTREVVATPATAEPPAYAASTASAHAAQGAHATEGAPPGETQRAPLGLVAHARSGDKGGNANVGVWVSDPDAWPWLATTLTTERVRALLPEAAPLKIERYEFPNLRAVNFVIYGLLDGGAVEAKRYDKQAKALGEWIRARHVDIPVRFLGKT